MHQYILVCVCVFISAPSLAGTISINSCKEFCQSLSIVLNFLTKMQCRYESYKALKKNIDTVARRVQH